jgi:hypothetical protein
MSGKGSVSRWAFDDLLKRHDEQMARAEKAERERDEALRVLWRVDLVYNRRDLFSEKLSDEAVGWLDDMYRAFGEVTRILGTKP